jgi:hypothetical protein
MLGAWTRPLYVFPRKAGRKLPWPGKEREGLRMSRWFRNHQRVILEYLIGYGVLYVIALFGIMQFTHTPLSLERLEDAAVMVLCVAFIYEVYWRFMKWTSKKMLP